MNYFLVNKEFPACLRNYSNVRGNTLPVTEIYSSITTFPPLFSTGYRNYPKVTGIYFSIRIFSYNTFSS